MKKKLFKKNKIMICKIERKKPAPHVLKSVKYQYL